MLNVGKIGNSTTTTTLCGLADKRRIMSCINIHRLYKHTINVDRKFVSQMYTAAKDVQIDFILL